MKDEWKPDELRENAEKIRSSVTPKSVTPEMVGSMMVSIVDALEDIRGGELDRRLSAVNFYGVTDKTLEQLDNSDKGRVYWFEKYGAFIEVLSGQGPVDYEAVNDYTSDKQRFFVDHNQNIYLLTEDTNEAQVLLPVSTPRDRLRSDFSISADLDVDSGQWEFSGAHALHDIAESHIKVGDAVEVDSGVITPPQGIVTDVYDFDQFTVLLHGGRLITFHDNGQFEVVPLGGDNKQDKLEDSEDVTVDVDTNKLSVTVSAKRAVFNDMWDRAWTVGTSCYGKYDPENAPDAEHPYMGNEIWMTYDEAVRVYAYRIRNEAAMEMSCKNVPGLRTALAVFKPIYGEFWSISEAFRSCADIEVVHLGKNFGQGIYISKMDYAFYQCSKLREIRPFIIERGGGTHGVAYGSFYYMAFFGCAALEEVRIFALKSDISFKDSPLLSFDSVDYMVANAANTFAITITVHPDVYAKLTGADGADYGDDSAEDWLALLSEAAAKNISFATV